MADPVPLRREPVLAALRALEPELRARGIAALYLFGSVARDAATEASDVDVFCDLPPESAMGVFEFLDIRHRLEDELNRDVDMTTRRGLHRLIRDDVEGEALRVF